MRPFTWRNCSADVYAMFHAPTVLAYIDEVVVPATLAIDNKIETLAQSAEGSAPFAKADMETLRSETMMAFALAIQSLWERQIRDYIATCATQLQLEECVRKDASAIQWDRVENAFLAARGISIKEFPSYPLLRALHLLGNICRHGDGPSVAKLRELHPEFWPNLTAPKVISFIEPARPSARLSVALDHLRNFGGAISDFWEDTDTIYLQSIEPKNEQIISELNRRRSSGRWFSNV